jgi:GT2 family glycosyltransferase
MLEITCIIPTLNRPDDVVRLANSLKEAIDETTINFNILLVDNSADANFRDQFESIDFGYPATYIHEKKPGLSNARNAAIEHDNKAVDYYCTIDDDIIVPSDFFLRMQKSIMDNEQAIIIGGRVELFDKRDLPVTIKTNTERSIYNGMELFGFIFGCAMLIKASVFQDVGIFDPKLGAGTKNGGSEDSDLMYRAWEYYQRKLPIIYEPYYFVFHNHGRRDPSYISKLLINYSRGQGGFLVKHSIFYPKRYIFKYIWWELLSDIKKEKESKKHISKGRKWYSRLTGGLCFLIEKIFSNN